MRLGDVDKRVKKRERKLGMQNRDIHIFALKNVVCVVVWHQCTDTSHICTVM